MAPVGAPVGGWPLTELSRSFWLQVTVVITILSKEDKQNVRRVKGTIR
jgi:hypothetical protein